MIVVAGGESPREEKINNRREDLKTDARAYAVATRLHLPPATAAAAAAACLYGFL